MSWVGSAGFGVVWWLGRVASGWVIFGVVGRLVWVRREKASGTSGAKGHVCWSRRKTKREGADFTSGATQTLIGPRTQGGVRPLKTDAWAYRTLDYTGVDSQQRIHIRKPSLSNHRQLILTQEGRRNHGHLHGRSNQGSEKSLVALGPFSIRLRGNGGQTTLARLGGVNDKY